MDLLYHPRDCQSPAMKPFPAMRGMPRPLPVMRSPALLTPMADVTSPLHRAMQSPCHHRLAKAACLPPRGRPCYEERADPFSSMVPRWEDCEATDSHGLSGVADSEAMSLLSVVPRFTRPSLLHVDEVWLPLPHPPSHSPS